MKGLMLKEFYVMYRYRNTSLLYLLIFGGMGIFTGNVSMYSIMTVMFIINMPLSNFGVDEACKWDKMAITTPLSRRQIVASKYWLMLGCILFSILITVVVVGIGSIVRPERTDFFLTSIISASAGLGVMTIMMMVLLPVLFKVGAEKARLMMMLIFGGSLVVIVAGAIVLMEIKGVTGYASDTVNGAVIFGAFVVLPLAVLFAMFVSYRVSCAIYAKREF